MFEFRRVLFYFALLLVCLCRQPAFADPAPSAAASSVSPQQAQHLLTLLRDDKQRAQFIANLQALVQTTATAALPTALPLAPDGLGAQVLEQGRGLFGQVLHQLRTTSRAFADLPRVGIWLMRMETDADLRDRMLDTVLKIAVILAAGVAAEWALRRLLRHPLSIIRDHAPIAFDADALHAETLAAAKQDSNSGDHHRSRLGAAWHLLRTLPYVAGNAILEVLPLAAFLVVAELLLITPLGTPALARVAAIRIILGYTAFRLTRVALRVVVLPECGRIRLLRVPDDSAAYLERWTRRIVATVVIGLCSAQIAVLLGLDPDAGEAVLKLVALVTHVLLVIVVLQCRDSVARRIRARPTRRGWVALACNRLARVWHWIAIFYIVALWVVWAVEIRDGLSRLLHSFLITVVVVVAARVVAVIILGALYRGVHLSPDFSGKHPDLQRRADRYFPVIRVAVSLALATATALVLLQAWGFHPWLWLDRTGLGGRLISAIISIAATLLLAIVVWEIANASLDAQISRLAETGQAARMARLRTLMPILQTSLLIAILIIVGLTVLSEIGVNIAPLLAGAGIIGVALGFGSQKLVQDLITGLFLLLENAMQVGDTVTVSGLSGVVEHLSIRTIRLRAGDGAVHIVPFSAVTSVTNTNRGVGNAAVSVTIGYHEDTDRAADLLRAIAIDLRADPDYAALMISDLQFWGVDKIDGATVTLVGQIVCIDTGRWGVQREYNRRVKQSFQDAGIELAPPTQAVLLREAAPPKLVVRGNEGMPANTRIESPPPSALGHEN